VIVLVRRSVSETHLSIPRSIVIKFLPQAAELLAAVLKFALFIKIGNMEDNCARKI